MTPAEAIRCLGEVDAWLDQRCAPRRGLDPQRSSARKLTEVLAPCLVGGEGPLIAAFVEGTAAFVRAQVESFPENLLWDFDLPLVTWWNCARASADPVGLARRQLGIATEIQTLFGRATALSFRYAHDFIYGYDWAKWVGRDPQARADIGPFALPFLEAMQARGHELLAVIAAGGDPKYPVLPPSTPRNPFPFSREPAAELAILDAVAAAGQLPVPAWRAEASPSWAAPWATWREQAAARLGFAKPVTDREKAD